ncbi:MAG: acyloxyacyl hydrolase [Pseudomonadota bacterium]
MKKITLMMILMIAQSVFVQAQAEEGLYSLAVDVGESKDDIGIYRLGVRRDFSHWLENSRVPLSGYFEASLNYWNGSENDIYAFAFSPVLALHLCRDCNYTPYIEAGIGVALLSETDIDGRDMSSTFQFEDRVGVGIRSGDLDFHVRYMHYSNAGLSQPNNGIDIFVGGMAYRF